VTGREHFLLQEEEKKVSPVGKEWKPEEREEEKEEGKCRKGRPKPVGPCESLLFVK
jgi:hypothetical protein